MSFGPHLGLGLSDVRPGVVMGSMIAGLLLIEFIKSNDDGNQ